MFGLPLDIPPFTFQPNTSTFSLAEVTDLIVRIQPFRKEEKLEVANHWEIGSEGRNFQQAHHLILFDLPASADLLEQRIGRVDRIGQKNIIQIHVPYVLGTDQEILARWYAHGLPLFKGNVNGLHRVFSRFESELTALIRSAKKEKNIDEKINKLTNSIISFKNNNLALLNLINDLEINKQRLASVGFEKQHKSAHICKRW